MFHNITIVVMVAIVLVASGIAWWFENGKSNVTDETENAGKEEHTGK